MAFFVRLTSVPPSSSFSCCLLIRMGIRGKGGGSKKGEGDFLSWRAYLGIKTGLLCRRRRGRKKENEAEGEELTCSNNNG